MWQVKAACYEHHYEKCFKNHSWPCFRVGLDQMTFRDPFQPKLLYNILKCLFSTSFSNSFPKHFLACIDKYIRLYHTQFLLATQVAQSHF